MKFISTRGTDGRLYTFEEAVLKGWADDGGMLMPQKLPNLAEELEAWVEAGSSCTYKDLCFAIMSKFTDKEMITDEELREICDAAFQKFDIPEVVRLEEIKGVGGVGGASTPATYVAELWHGPTLAFKDLSLQVLCGFLEKLLLKKKQKLQLLVATSGDTGAASIEGVLGKERLSVCVLYPSRRFSSITQEQEYQTVCHAGEANVAVVEVEGSSDDIDVPVEACFRDLDFKEKASVGSSNSVNIFRVMMQCVHYFYLYVKLRQMDKKLEGIGGKVAFYVPTGGGGHISAGVLAAEMGLPVHSVFACVNENDVMHELLSSGKLDSNSPVEKTLAPSMDIKFPYNLERILFLMSNQNREKVREYMKRWKSQGKVELGDGELKVLMDVMRLKSQTVSNKEISQTIGLIFERQGYVLDPHTAVAVRSSLNDETPGVGVRVCMGCAHPSKFSKTVSEALSLEPSQWMPNRDNPFVASLLRLLTKATTTEEEDEEEEGVAKTQTSRVHHFSQDEKKLWEQQLRSILASAKM